MKLAPIYHYTQKLTGKDILFLPTIAFKITKTVKTSSEGRKKVLKIAKHFSDKKKKKSKTSVFQLDLWKLPNSCAIATKKEIYNDFDFNSKSSKIQNCIAHQKAA